MKGLEIIDFPKRYACPNCHCVLVIENINHQKWYDSEGNEFTPLPQKNGEKDIEDIERELEIIFRNK